MIFDLVLNYKITIQLKGYLFYTDNYRLYFNVGFKS